MLVTLSSWLPFHVFRLFFSNSPCILSISIILFSPIGHIYTFVTSSRTHNLSYITCLENTAHRIRFRVLFLYPQAVEDGTWGTFFLTASNSFLASLPLPNKHDSLYVIASTCFSAENDTIFLSR